MAWGTKFSLRLTYTTWSLGSLRVSARRVCDNFPRARCCERDHRRYISCILVVNPKANCRGDDWDGPVDQYFCCKFPLLVSENPLFFLSLVWVSTFGSLAGSTSMSFYLELKYPALSIANPFSISASTSELFSLSLVNITFTFSPCVLVITRD